MCPTSLSRPAVAVACVRGDGVCLCGDGLCVCGVGVCARGDDLLYVAMVRGYGLCVCVAIACVHGGADQLWRWLVCAWRLGWRVCVCAS